MLQKQRTYLCFCLTFPEDCFSCLYSLHLSEVLSVPFKHQEGSPGDAWLDQSTEHVTLGLGVLSSRPMLGL